MKGMPMKRTCLMMLVAATLALSATEGQAAGRRAQAQPNAVPQNVAQPGQNAPVWIVPGQQPYRYNPYYQYKAMYPKYYYGIHSRSQQNIGIPNGDIGIRGNSITPYPW